MLAAANSSANGHTQPPPELSWPSLSAGQPIEHGPQHSHLGPGLSRVGSPTVAPPVPASLRVRPVLVGRRGLTPGLRIEHDDVVGFCPAIVASVSDELLLDVRDRLLAAMKCDVGAADFIARWSTGGGNIGETCVV